MGTSLHDGDIHEKYLQAVHQEERFKQQKAELEMAFLEAEERRQEGESEIAELQRKLREATKMAAQKAQEAEVADALSSELEAAQKQLLEVKQTLSEKDKLLSITKQELQDHQEVLHLLDERDKQATIEEHADLWVSSVDTTSIASESPDMMDPEMLRQQQQEIARLRDLLDEEAERRRQAESALELGRASHNSIEGLSLEAELARLSLGDQYAFRSPSPPISIDPAELERLETEKADVLAQLDAERARFAEEQAAMKKEQERLHLDAATRAAAEQAACKARDEMERHLEEEKARVQAKLDAERARFIAAARASVVKAMRRSTSDALRRRRALYAASRGLSVKGTVDLRSYVSMCCASAAVVLATHPASQHMVHGNVRMSAHTCVGVLSKKGKNRHNWKKRWFLFDLRHQRVAYFEAATMRKEAGAFGMKEVIHVLPAPHESERPEDIEKEKRKLLIVTPKRTWQLLAPTEAARNVWLAVFETIGPEVATVRRSNGVQASPAHTPKCLMTPHEI
eukprot:m.198460 g.198460  ORF g.198460 m.198460 type:complete len:514 (+) comp20455_c0_seq1:86-1627(+)